MIHHDEILIDPQASELEASLRLAAAAVYRDLRIRKPSGLLDKLPEFHATLARLREGSHRWLTVPESRNASDQGKLAVTWWTDFIGRRHLRVTGLSGSHIAYQLFWPALAPLATIYPEFCYRLNQQSTGNEFVACPCGAVGLVTELAWMGRECGICYDRRATGLPLDRVFDLPRYSIDINQPVKTFAYDPTHQIVIAQNPNSATLWSLPTGTARTVNSLAGVGIACTSDGETIVTAVADRRDPGLRIMRAESLQRAGMLASSFAPQELAFSPSGRWLIGVHQESPEHCELRVYHWALREELLRVTRPTRFAWALSPDERVLCTMSNPTEFQCHVIGSTTPAETRQVWNPRGYSASDWAIRLHYSRNGRTLISRGAHYLRIIDIDTGQVMTESQMVEYFNPDAPSMLSDDGNVLMIFHNNGLIYRHLPTNKVLKSVDCLLRSNPDKAAFAGEWFILHFAGILYAVPWRPLLEFVCREARSG